MILTRTENGSLWSVSENLQQPHGRPIPAARRFWVFKLEGEAPDHLRGTVGFYAGTLAAVSARLRGVRK